MRAALALWMVFPLAAAAQEGIFDGQGDVGTVLHKGFVEYMAGSRAYRVTGSGENVWGTADAFQFAWKRIAGDLSITADISFSNTEGEEHKKAMLMIRESLDADSAYADAALHGNGLTSLQSRDEKGAATHEIQSNVSAPRRLRITKAGQYFYMSIAAEGEELHPAGGAMRVPIEGPYYVGLGVCAHNKDEIASAAFSNVQVTPAVPSTASRKLYSTLETIMVASTDRRVVYTAPERLESPTWTTDNMLLFTAGGKRYRVPVDGGKPEEVTAERPAGAPDGSESERRISPDGQRAAFLAQEEQTEGEVTLRMITLANQRTTVLAKFRAVPGTINLPSWSPDGRRLAFVSYQLIP